MPDHKGAFVAVALVAAAVAVLLVMWVADIGFFSDGSHTAVVTTNTTRTTSTTTTTTIPILKVRVFNPAIHAESQTYFVSLWRSVKATQAEIKKQEQVVKSDPSISNHTALIAMTQNCAALVVAYNAAAQQIASSAFRSVGLPPQIPPDDCST